MNISKRILTWMIIVYVLTILALSAAVINTKAALNRTSVMHIRLDHLLHVLLFIPWMVMIQLRWKEKKGVGFLVLALTAGLFLATISEGLQLFVPERAFDSLDLLANCVGVCIGTMTMTLGRFQASG